MTGRLEDHKHLDTISFEAMNTNFYFAVTGCIEPNWKEIIHDWVRYVEREWSRFRTGNELWQLNHLDIDLEMSVSPPLFDLLQKAEDYRRKTNGVFSPYLLPQMRFHGYENSFPFQTSSMAENLLPPLYDKQTAPFLFDSDTKTVKRMAAGQIDLGGIGKGYTVQAAAGWLKNEGKAPAGMADGGGDMTVWSDGSKEWKIGVSHPLQKDVEIAQFLIKNGSIATSNVIYRSWTQGNEKKHHILNGRTGLPADNNIIQATVKVENCLDAEVGAKLCLIEDAINMKDQLKILSPDCSILLVNNQGKILAG